MAQETSPPTGAQALPAQVLPLDQLSSMSPNVHVQTAWYRTPRCGSFQSIACLFTQLPKSAVSQFLKENKVPDISSQLQFCRNPSKGRWTEGTFCLGSLGIYLVSQRKVLSSMSLLIFTITLLVFTLFNSAYQQARFGRWFGSSPVLPT